MDRVPATIRDELVAGPLAPLPFGGAVMHRFHPYGHRASCCCQLPIRVCDELRSRCSRCEIYWALAELLIALVLLLIFVVTGSQLPG
ncbi:MAG: hypothetical protein M3021_06695 [Actinomycetota bacterium]|nr:hypothetical protein [Actinomycetota bacterium]